MNKNFGIGLVMACLLVCDSVQAQQQPRSKYKIQQRSSLLQPLPALEAPQIAPLRVIHLRDQQLHLGFRDGYYVEERVSYVIEDFAPTPRPNFVPLDFPFKNMCLEDARTIWSITMLNNYLSLLPGFYQRRYNAECKVKGGGEEGNAYYLDGLRLY